MERKRTYVGLGVTGLGLSIAAGLWLDAKDRTRARGDGGDPPAVAA